MTHYLDYPGLTYYHGRLNSYIGEELANLLPKSEEGEILYVYAGQVDNYSDLPTDANPGDVYNVINADPDNNVKAGDNIAWTGTEWDDLSGYIDTSLYEKYADALADKEELLAEVSDIDTDLTDNYVASESFESIMSEYVKTAEVEFDKLTDEEIIRAFSPWYWVKLPEDSEGNLVTDINAYYIGNDYYWHKFIYNNNGYLGVPKRLVNPNGFATECHTMITCEALNGEDQFCPTVAAFAQGNGIYNNEPVVFGTDFEVSKTPIMIAAPSQYAGNMPDVDTSALQETVSSCGDTYGFIYDIKDYEVDTQLELVAAEEREPDETVEVYGTITWNDNNDSENDRPSDVFVRLFANGTEIDTASVLSEDGWRFNFTDLPKYENSELINYAISVDDIVWYDSAINKSETASGYTFEITFTHYLLATVSLHCEVSYEGDKLPDDFPVGEIVIYQNGKGYEWWAEVNHTGWSFVTSLPKYANTGGIYEYSIGGVDAAYNFELEVIKVESTEYDYDYKVIITVVL